MFIASLSNPSSRSMAMTAKYLDYNATTPVGSACPGGDERLVPGAAGQRGQPDARVRPAGQGSGRNGPRAGCRRDRAQSPTRSLFTSGATESDNLVVFGLAAFGERRGRKHIVSTVIEHKAVLEPLVELGRRGFEIELAPVTAGGYVEPDAIRQRLRAGHLAGVRHARQQRDRRTAAGPGDRRTT